jgi:hypothetical protein
MPTIIISPYEQELDMSDKNGAKLYEKGAEKLPSKFTGEVKDFRLFINDVVSQATECCWDISILNFVIDGETLNLLTDYGRIPMQTIVDARNLRNAVTPATNKDARPHIDSIMMYKCLENSIENKVRRQIMSKLTDIGRDGPTMFKQITVGTFTTTQAQTFSIKTELYSMDLKQYKYNILDFHQNVDDKIDTLNAVGKPPADEDIIIGLFKAYATSDNDLFKEHVRFLKSEYNEGCLSNRKDLMLKTESKYDKLRTENKWKPVKKEDDPSVLALNTMLNKVKTYGEENKKKTGENPKTPPWKYDKTIGSNGAYSKSVEGVVKEYKWCDGPGHGGKGMWVLHVPGACTNRNGPNHKTGGNAAPAPSSDDKKKLDDSSIQALQMILEQAQPGDDVSAAILAILE